jgi:hypothetical protein
MSLLTELYCEWAIFLQIGRAYGAGWHEKKWFAENGWTSRFCGRNLKFMNGKGRTFAAKLKFFDIWRMTRLIRYVLAIIMIQSNCFAEVTKLPAADQKALHDISRFRALHSVTNLPPAIVALCADYHGRLAEPGKKWDVTDVITDDKLPTKRLIWAFTNDDYYVVHYEQGGIGHSFHVLVVKWENGNNKLGFVWRGYCLKNLKDFRAFLDAIDNNGLDDKLEEYGH